MGCRLQKCVFPAKFPDKSNTPQQATGMPSLCLVCSPQRGGVFDPRGIRQIRVQAPVLDSLLAGIIDCKSAGPYSDLRPALWHMINIVCIVTIIFY